MTHFALFALVRRISEVIHLQRSPKPCPTRAGRLTLQRRSFPGRFSLVFKIPRITVHELRHTAAPLMIASGANVKTVQAQLSQKTATMTLDQYGHLFPDDLDDMADTMDNLVSECAQNMPTKEAGQGDNTL